MKMNSAQKKARQVSIEQNHAMYRDYNQGRDGFSEDMAMLGHPMAALYKCVASSFFSLRYCSNASERIMAINESGSECVTLHRPEIRERRDRIIEIDGEHYYGVYPSHPDYQKFLTAFAGSKFKSSDAFIGCIFTTICIKTSRDDVKDALRSFSSDQPHLKLSWSSGRYHIELVRVNKKLPPLKVWRELMSFLKAHFKSYWLPKALSDVDNTEVPFQERPIRLAAIDSVDITPRSIRLPLIRVGDQDHQLLVVNEVLALLQKGYPLNASIEQYLSKVINPKALLDLKKEYEKAA